MSVAEVASECESAPEQARVAFVGAGPGDAGLLTLRAVELLAQARAVVVDARTPMLASGVLERWCQLDVDVIETLAHGAARTTEDFLKERARQLIDAVQAAPGGLVVRLMDGDPAVFGGLTEEAMACTLAGVPFEVVPGVSRVTAIPTYAGVPLTSTSSTGVHVLSAHQHSEDLSHLIDPQLTVVVVGVAELVTATLAQLRAAGRDRETPVAVTERGTSVEQRTTTTTLAAVARSLRNVSGETLAVVGAAVELREHLSWFETKALFGWRVLVPRTKDASAPMVDQLRVLGAAPTVVPTISVEPPRTPAQLERAVRGLVEGRYEWVGFTSVNAVRAIREKLSEIGLDTRAIAGVRVAAVGGVTAAALTEWGIIPDLVPTHEQSTRGLLEVWPEFDPADDPINRVLLPRADIATDTLVAGLGDLGWEVDDVTAYRTVRAHPPAPHIRDAIKNGSFDAVLFTSSATVRNLVGIAGKPHAATIIGCIGPATASTAQDLGIRVDVVAAQASAPALVEALAEHAVARAQAVAESGTGVVRPSQRRTGGRRRTFAG